MSEGALRIPGCPPGEPWPREILAEATLPLLTSLQIAHAGPYLAALPLPTLPRSDKTRADAHSGFSLLFVGTKGALASAGAFNFFLGRRAQIAAMRNVRGLLIIVALTTGTVGCGGNYRTAGGAAVGGATGVIGGALIAGPVGAVAGGAAGAATGAALSR
jgi:hypothetical protein